MMPHLSRYLLLVAILLMGRIARAEPATPVNRIVHVDRRGDPLPAGAGTRLGTLRFRHDAAVSSVALSTDGKWIASTGRDYTLRVWDAATGRELHRFQEEHPGLRSPTFSPDGKILAAMSKGGIRLWNLATGEEQRELSLTGRVYPLAFAFSSDGQALVFTDSEALIHRYELADGKAPQSLGRPLKGVNVVAFSPDGRLLATGEGEGTSTTVRVWDAITRTEHGVLRSPERRFQSIAFSPDGKTLAVAGLDIIRLWELSTGRVVLQVPGGAAFVLFSPDGGTLVTGTYDGTIHCYDSRTGREIRTWRGSGGAVSGLAFSLDGSLLVSGGSDGLIRLWDAATGKPRFHRTGHAAVVRSVALSPGGKMLVSAGGDHSLRLWDVEAGRELFTRSLPRPGGGGFGPGIECPHSVAFAPDGKTVAALSDDCCVYVWEVDSGKERLRLAGHENTLYAVAYSPDGKVLASGGRDGSLRLWNLSTGRELLRIAEREQPQARRERNGGARCFDSTVPWRAWRRMARRWRSAAVAGSTTATGRATVRAIPRVTRSV